MKLPFFVLSLLAMVSLSCEDESIKHEKELANWMLGSWTIVSCSDASLGLDNGLASITNKDNRVFVSLLTDGATHMLDCLVLYYSPKNIFFQITYVTSDNANLGTLIGSKKLIRNGDNEMVISSDYSLSIVLRRN